MDDRAAEKNETECIQIAVIRHAFHFLIYLILSDALERPNNNLIETNDIFRTCFFIAMNMRSDEVLRPRVCATQLCICNTHFSLYTHWFVVQFVRLLVVTHIWCSDCMHSESLNNEHKPTESCGTHSTAGACIFFFFLLLIFTLWLHLVPSASLFCHYLRHVRCLFFKYSFGVRASLRWAFARPENIKRKRLTKNFTNETNRKRFEPLKKTYRQICPVQKRCRRMANK